ncbi:hypothetical protein [Woeseia oceani]|uniref:hypothetical protein n=1 Tax=Woeseia oceani TaxID=1548547 RepID=UPI0018D33382|nr:hypothetical protein [Woeseia oceani]
MQRIAGRYQVSALQRDELAPWRISIYRTGAQIDARNPIISENRNFITADAVRRYAGAQSLLRLKTNIQSNKGNTADD